MTTHFVKIQPLYFEGIISGSKPFELRYNDRKYKVGDCVCLQECIVSGESPFKHEVYTNRCCYVLIKDIYNLNLIDSKFDNYIIFTFYILRIIK